MRFMGNAVFIFQSQVLSFSLMSCSPHSCKIWKTMNWSYPGGINFDFARVLSGSSLVKEFFCFFFFLPSCVD